MSELTREQVEEAVVWTQSVDIWYQLEGRKRILEADAALRAMLEELEHVIADAAWDDEHRQDKKTIAELQAKVAALEAGICVKCNMGPLRESCAYPEACQHPGRELAYKLNQALLGGEGGGDDMSTSYYRLNEPFTSLRLEEGPGHDKLTIFEQGANCGTLTLSRGWGKRVARLFSMYEDDDKCPLRTHWGGKERGAVVTVHDEALPDEATVVSEYGDVLTVAQVKARDGAQRKDGWPTELFGYEKQAPQ